ncbi:MAG: hypothetical protein JWL85_225, partial [Candidatus Saccharibacteria bacterium]|nr:hypothetical protein [Candidatus Saccharibacteria bacterium]
MREESSFPDPERIIIATAFEQSIQTALSPVLRNIKLRNLHRFYEDPRIYAARALNESGKRLFYACLDPGSISPDTPFRGLPFSPRCFLEIAKIDPA